VTLDRWIDTQPLSMRRIEAGDNHSGIAMHPEGIFFERGLPHRRRLIGVPLPDEILSLIGTAVVPTRS
jgi:hypothetical protein